MTPLEQIAGEVGGRLDVVADLAVDVDGTRMHLRGDGRRVVLDVDDPSALRDRTSSLDVRAVARALDHVGVQVEIRSPRGTVAEIGAGVTGRAPTLLRAPVRPGGAAAFLVPRPVTVGVAAVLVGVVLWLAARPRSPGS